MTQPNLSQQFYQQFADGQFIGYIDLRLLIARHATSLLYGEGVKLSSPKPEIAKFLHDWALKSRFQMVLEQAEQILSAQGRLVLVLNKSLTDDIYISIANPPMINKVGRIWVQENSATIWTRFVFDDRMFWSRQEYDTEKVVTQLYGGESLKGTNRNETINSPIREDNAPWTETGSAKNTIKRITTLGLVSKVFKHLQINPVWYHRMRCCPLVELYNLPDYIFNVAYVGYNPDLRAEHETLQTSLTNLINIYNEALFTTKPRVLMGINPQQQQIINKNTQALVNNPALESNFIQHSGVGENGQTLIDVIQSKVQAQDYIGAIHETIGLAYFVAGYNYDGNPQKSDLTATGAILGRERDIQTTKRKRTYRMFEISRLVEKVLIAKGLMNFGEERPFTFEIKTNLLINTLTQAQTQEILLHNKLTSRQDAIAVIHGLSQDEALAKKKAIDKELEKDAPLYERLLKQTAPVETKQIVQENAQAKSENNLPRKRTPSDFRKGAGA